MARRCFSPKSCTWAEGRSELTISAVPCRSPTPWVRPLAGLELLEGQGAGFKTGVPQLPREPRGSWGVPLRALGTPHAPLT